MQSINFDSRDGQRLTGTLYRPTAITGPVRGAVLLVCAMGVAQTFYRSFCEWLTDEGFVAMTFDYRGMGLSRTRPLRDERADVMTWAELDTPAAFEFLAATVPEVPIIWLGHSLGGQIFSFAMDRVNPAAAIRLKKMTYIAAGSGYWRENAAPTLRLSWLFWFVLGPLLTRICGYWPGARLGIVGDLPAGVFHQWKQWCMNREYAVGALPARYRQLAANVTVPITAVSFTDDEMMSEKNIDSLKAVYPPERLKALRYTPESLGVKRIGHFGGFRRNMRDVLWRPVILGELPGS